MNAPSFGHGWNFQQSYATLPEILYRQVQPATFPKPEVVIFNQPLASQLGLSWDDETLLGELFTGQLNLPHPYLAQAYAGHQFGGFTMLGDGRALLLAEHQGPDGRLWDIQLKGSGQTPFSRSGDGRAVLGPMLREFLISEAMAALQVPTTRSLAVTSTGESVFRETPSPGAVLTRVAASHLRVGTFQFAAAIQRPEVLAALVEYTIQRHYPELQGSDTPALSLLEQVALRQAKLVANWQSIGFIHGVMNTDNVSLAGETIDYGPCAFMDYYDPGTVFSSIDRGGRYAYQQQPVIAQWNLARFAETLLPLVHSDTETAVDEVTNVLHRFPEQFEQAWLQGMRRKLGFPETAPIGMEFIQRLLNFMYQHQCDFTNTFDDLSTGNLEAAVYQQGEFCDWLQQWQNELRQLGRSPLDARQPMRQVNPAVIPRNHLLETALQAATVGDLQPFQELLQRVQDPFRRPVDAKFREGLPPGSGYQTFCGT